jgi:hypothetical protein
MRGGWPGGAQLIESASYRNCWDAYSPNLPLDSSFCFGNPTNTQPMPVQLSNTRDRDIPCFEMVARFMIGQPSPIFHRPVHYPCRTPGYSMSE